MGILVEGMIAQDALKAIDAGQFDEKISSGKTEITAEEKARLDTERKKLQADMEKRRGEFEIKAKSLIKNLEGKDAKKIRKDLAEAGIPQTIIDELAPAEQKK